MRSALASMLLASSLLAGCQGSVSFGDDGKPVFRQSAISDIACGPSALFNWMSHGGADLRGVLSSLSEEKTPVQTVRHLIDTYGKRRSATNPSEVRYGSHNGGVGSVNLMLMATELLADHLVSPPALRGEYLQRLEGESTGEHLGRIVGWFSRSIDGGIPVILYLRAYERTDSGRRPRMVFGHHVVVTSLDTEVALTDGGALYRVGFTFVDSSSGRSDRAELIVARDEFTAPTFSYRFDGDRAITTETLRTGREVLEVRIRSYGTPGDEIVLAHFATFGGPFSDVKAEVVEAGAS